MNKLKASENQIFDGHSSSESYGAFNRLKTLLREMFQLDRGDLDFGLYRIMNLKKIEIEAFLDNDLLPQVKAAISGFTEEEQTRLKAKLTDTIKRLNDLQASTENNKSVLDLRAKLTQAKADANAEGDVYNLLTIFFARYYSEGDFMSHRRYSSGGRATYVIPYDGEEVKLHWANADQFYIKTTENYSTYAFIADDAPIAFRVRFEVVATDNEKDYLNEADSRQKRFVLVRDRSVVECDGDDLVIRFEHRLLSDSEQKAWSGSHNQKQKKINDAAAVQILNTLHKLAPKKRIALAALAPTEAEPQRTVLAKHIERYTAKNSFDYFIHKDLDGFLRRELDFYLKNEVLILDELELDDAGRLRHALARIRATRQVGEKIIAFLAQLENFQKRLWLKKKFVLETQWCVTLDRIPLALYPVIAANAEQCEEWINLFAINEISSNSENNGSSNSDQLSIEFLKANPYLVVDTRHFNSEFVDNLLVGLSNGGSLDEQTDGLLVHAENFQALNLLHARFQNQVQCIYIDPPYNTGDSEILYKNNYLKSSWLSLMANRLEMGTKLLAPDSVTYIAIDDFEMVDLAKLIDTQFPWLRREMIIVNHHPQGGKAKTLAHTHEYMLACMSKSYDRTLVGRMSDDGVEFRRFQRSGTAESNFRYGRPNSFYAILVDPNTHEVVGLESPPDTNELYPKEPTKNGLVRIYPIGKNNAERVWRKSYESCQNLVNDEKLHCSPQMKISQKIPAEERRAALFSNWIDPRYNAGTYGANLLGDLLGTQNSFYYPKSVHTVEDAIYAAGLCSDSCILDFFAGSGTTGHAVVNINREDGGKRKYILVEVADYFDTVLLPRMKKVFYSQDWKGGKPESRDKGVSQLVKYICLESYEDTLDGLVLTPNDEDLLADSSSLAEDYKLRYALNAETSGSACLLGGDFTNPFTYTLSVVRNGVQRDVSADLPETFNYLIGLRVETRRRLNGILTFTGKDAAGQSCLVLWRNLETTGNEALEYWFINNRVRFSESLNVVYVNGDHTLNAIRRQDETWFAETIEPLFRELMFQLDER